MNENDSRRSYKRDLKRAYIDSVEDICLYGILTVLFTAGAVLTCVKGRFRDWCGDYRIAILCAMIAFGELSLNGMFTAFRRKRGVKEISESSVYAVKLTQKQQNRILSAFSVQIAESCILAFAGMAVPVLLYCGIRYITTRDLTELVVSGVFTAVWLLVCLFSYGFELADIVSRDGFCTVSGKGIITAEKVYDFEAELGDVFEIGEDDECYLVRFKRRSFFWVRLSTEFPLPKGGAVSRNLGTMDEREVLNRYLRPLSVAEPEPVPEIPAVFRERKTREPKLGGVQKLKYKAEKTEKKLYTAEKNIEEETGQAEESAAEDEQKEGKKRPGYLIWLTAMILVAAIGLGYAYVYTHGWPEWMKKQTPDPEPVPVIDPEPGPVIDPDPVEAIKKYTLHKDGGAWYFTYGGEEILFVDDDHPMDSSFGRSDHTAEKACETMMAAAYKDGIDLYIVRGYRSYERQGKVYESYAAPLWAVPAGYSEHQGGCAFDLDKNGASGTMQDDSFAETDAFRWLVRYGPEYGFILRYPEDSSDITGRCYEPWHFRYVGRDLAMYLTEKGLLLDEIIEKG